MDGRPNILVIMSDEHAPMYSHAYGHARIETPHMDALAARGTLFRDAYCPSPLCVPSRAAFVAGKHVHRIGAYDNGAPFPSETVTFPHLLRAAGYEVVLDGKMHFVGPDTLHGFERQLTRDAHRQPDAPTITGREWSDPHPAGGARPRERIESAGPGRAAHLDFDDEVEEAALEWLRARGAPGGRGGRRDGPWCLVAGFLAPHFPLIVPEPYFNRYYPDNVDLPAFPPDHLAGQHPAHERVRRTFNLYDYSEEQIRVARAAYYGLVTYMDDKIGRLVGALRETGQLEDTLVVYTSDHGELAGDHGLWWKNSFYEQASRVPLILSWPGAPQRVPAGARFGGAVSLLDLTRTLIDVAGAPDPGALDLDGDSLLPPLGALAGGDADGAAALWKDEVIVEYYGHATNRPQRMLRAGRWKYAYYHGEPAELYDLVADPQEFRNLAGGPEVAAIESALRRRLLADWDPEAVEEAVRRSQRARQLIGRATGARRREGEPEPQGIPGA
jgi:choline-sulfatase